MDIHPTPFATAAEAENAAPAGGLAPASPLCSSARLLAAARSRREAIGAFNAVDGVTVLGIVRGAELAGRPVIVQTSTSTVRHAGWALLHALVQETARGRTVPVVLHLDHCTDPEFVFQAIRSGWTSVMFDGSHLPLQDNIASTRRVVDFAREHGVTVEAELGHIGGVEDGQATGGSYRPVAVEEVVEFVERTGVDALALGIGNAHGIYRCSNPELDLGLLERASRRVPTPLVLHGGSGLPFETVRACVRMGVSKVNYSTDLKLAYRQAVARWLAQGTDDLLALQRTVAEEIEHRVLERIQVLTRTSPESLTSG